MDNFFQRIYKMVKTVPVGKVTTYGQVTLRLRSEQAGIITPNMVGWALHANRDPKVPCHRVVNKEGRLAPNFAWNGWEEQKARLLTEGVEFKDEMHVNLEKYLWNPSPRR